MHHFRSHSRLRPVQCQQLSIVKTQDSTQLSACRGCAIVWWGKLGSVAANTACCGHTPLSPAVWIKVLSGQQGQQTQRQTVSLASPPCHLDYLASPTSTSPLALQTTAGLLQAPEVASQRVVDVVLCGLVRQSRISTVRKLGFSFKRVLLTRVCES